MSNEMIKSATTPATLTESIAIGKLFFESGLFADIKSAAQAVVKIQAGAELGLGAYTSISGIHIIQGKPVLGAGIIAGKVKGSGKYDYEVMQQDDKACSIDFYQGKKKLGNSTFTIDDAKRAGTKNMDKYPRNMLFARAVSNGVKWYCPDVFNGPVYVPEEMEQVTEDVAHEEVVPPPPAPEKKRLTDKAVIQAVARINGGELTLKANILEAYELTPEQLSMIESAEPQNPQV